MMAAFALPFFRTALLASLVLAGIHAYLGFHIVRRGVIFVDLALAQMAALGVALALVLNVHENEHFTYALALGMTFVGAAVFAWLRGQEQRNVPLEAFIGIVFATAQAAVFLILEKSPSGPEHLKETLAGSLFTVAPRHVLYTAILYAVIGTAHFLLRKPFFEITNDPKGAEARGRKLFWWDLAFYGMFGFVVTSSVQIAGVLLVFGFLVIPAVAGLMATQRPGVALAIGWIFGFLGSLLGLLGSVQLDLPAAPSILVALTLLLAVLGAALALRKTQGRETAPAASARPSRERPGSVPHDGVAAAGRVAGVAQVERARRETAAVRSDE
ncbi:MAG: metal ABC transporter permease [bacterium]